MRSTFLIGLLSVLLGLNCALCPAAERRIPIHAWIGIPADQTSAERYRELADCGFTSSFSGFGSAQQAQAALDAAGKAGVRLFFHCPELSDDPEGTARRFKDHPALGGYHLRDEPSCNDFEQLARWARRIQAVDREHPCYINLFPTYASPQQLGCQTYQEHVDRFIAQVPVPFISFDHYPVVGDRLRGDWHNNLEIIRNASVKAGKPFWAFCLSVAHDPYPVPTIAHLRAQAFTNLAYGAQCIQYFTYWTPVSNTWNFHDAPIDPTGKRTGTYEVVKRMNREIQGLAGVFAGGRVLSVGHAGSRPAGTRAFEPRRPVKAVRIDGPGAVVSTIENGPSRYLVLVNRDINQARRLAVAFDAGASVRRVGKDGAKTPLAAGTFEDSLAPGDVRVFAWGHASAAGGGD